MNAAILASIISGRREALARDSAINAANTIQNLIEDEMNNQEKIPKRIREGIRRYVESGTNPGGFLMSMLAGDLFGAMDKADSETKDSILHIAYYIRAVVPSDAYGCMFSVVEWIRNSDRRDRVKEAK